MVNIAFNREKNLCFGCISRHLSDTKQTTHTHAAVLTAIFQENLVAPFIHMTQAPETGTHKYYITEWVPVFINSQIQVCSCSFYHSYN